MGGNYIQDTAFGRGKGLNRDRRKCSNVFGWYDDPILGTTAAHLGIPVGPRKGRQHVLDYLAGRGPDATCGKRSPSKSCGQKRKRSPSVSSTTSSASDMSMMSLITEHSEPEVAAPRPKHCKKRQDSVRVTCG